MQVDETLQTTESNVETVVDEQIPAVENLSLQSNKESQVLEEDTGIDSSIISQDDSFRQQLSAINKLTDSAWADASETYMEWRKGYPDAANAIVQSGEVKKMNAIESVGYFVNRANEQATIADIGKKIEDGTASQLEIDMARDLWKKSQEPEPEMGWFSKFSGLTASAFTELGRASAISAAKTAVAAPLVGATAASTGIAAPAVAAVGTSGIFLISLADTALKRAQGETYANMHFTEEATGNKYGKGVKETVSRVVGAFAALLNTFQVDKLTAGLGSKVASGFVVKGIEKLAASELVKKSAISATTKYAADLGVVGATAFGESVVRQLGEDIARASANNELGEDWERSSFKQIFDNAGSEAGMAVVASIIPLGVFSRIANSEPFVKTATDVAIDQMGVSKIVKSVGDLEQAQINQPDIENYFQSGTRGEAGEPLIYVTADGLREKFGDNAANVAQLMGKGDLFSASEAGDGTKIPMRLADYASKRKEWFGSNTMEEHLSTKADVLSSGEFALEQKIYAEKEALTAKAENAKETTKARRMVEQDITDRAMKGGKLSKGAAGRVGKIASHVFEAIYGDKAFEQYKGKKLDWQKKIQIRQGDGATARGAIEFANDGALIKLSESSDITTPVHETAHYLLEVANRAVDIPQPMADALDSFLAGYGIKRGKPISVEAHEAFATQIEAWMATGKAPVNMESGANLQPLFTSFRKAFAKTFGEPEMLESNPVTFLIAKMMGGDDALALHAEEMGIGDKVDIDPKDPQKPILTQRTFESELNDVLKPILRKGKNEQIGYIKEMEKIARKEAVNIVQDSPEYRAGKYLRDNKLLVADKDGKYTNDVSSSVREFGAVNALNLAEINDLYEKGILSDSDYSMLFKYSADEGMPLNDFATMFDKQGEAVSFIKETVFLADNYDKAISAKAAEWFYENANLGRLMDENGLKRDALLTAMKSDKYKSIRDDVRALNKLAGKEHSGIDVALIEHSAEAEFGTMTYSEGVSSSLPNSYIRKARSYGRMAEKAIAERRWAAAARYKKMQIEAFIKRDVFEAQQKKIKRLYDSVKNGRDRLIAKARIADPKLAEAVTKIYDIIDIDSRLTKADRTAARQTYARWVDEVENELGFRFDIPDIVRLGSETIGISELSINTLQQVASFSDTVRALSNTIIQDRRNAKNAYIANSAINGVSQLKSLFAKRFADRDSGKLVLASDDNALGKAKKSISPVAREVETVEVKMLNLDGDKTGGFFTKHIFRPIVDGIHRYMLGSLAQGKRLTNASKSYMKSLKARGLKQNLDQKVYSNTLNRQVTLHQAVMIAVHCGNDSSRATLLARGGNKIGLNADNISAFLDEVMGADEIKFANDISAILSENSARAEAHIRKRRGGEPVDMIQPTQTKLKNGTLDGGYVPIDYVDRKTDIVDGGTAWFQDLLDGVSPNNRSTGLDVHTKAGFAKVRMGFAGEVNLDMHYLFGHFDEVHRALELEDSITLVAGILRDKDLSDAMDVAGGSGTSDMVRSWLRDVAGANKRSDGAFIQKVIGGLNRNVTNAMLLFKPMTAIINRLGYIPAADEVGIGGMINGIAEINNPISRKKWVDFIYKESSFMKLNEDSFNRDIKLLSEGKLKGSSKNVYTALGMAMLRATVRSVNESTWVAAFKKAEKLGKSKSDAVNYADSVVRTTQGTGLDYGQSKLMRSNNEAVRLLTKFGSYGATIYNKVLQRVSAGKKIGGVKGSVVFSMSLFNLVLLPALLEQAMRGEVPPVDGEDSDWKRYISGLFINGISPLIPLSSLLTGRGGLGTSQVASTWRSIGAAVSGEEPNGYDVAKAVSSVAGVATGFPASSVNNVIRFFDRMNEGEDPNPMEIISPRYNRD